METVNCFNPKEGFAYWEALIKAEVKSSPLAPQMPGPVARLYFGLDGVANPGDLPTTEAVEKWASENGFKSAYDKGTDKYHFYISPSETVARAFEEGLKTMGAILKKDQS